MMKTKYHKISKQKMYEKAILKTYEHRIGKQVEKECEKMDYDIPETFVELMMKRDLFGFKRNIPAKHPFKKLGFSYLEQLFGMALTINDDDFSYDFFQFINTNLDLFDFNSQDQFDILYTFYYESLGGDFRDLTYAARLGDFILVNYNKKLLGMDKLYSMMMAFATTNLGFREFADYRSKIGV